MYEIRYHIYDLFEKILSQKWRVKKEDIWNIHNDLKEKTI